MTYYSIISKETPTNKEYGVKVIKEKSIENICDDYSIIKNLVDTCNNSKVDYDHFEDVLENFIEDFETF